jgi:uncharacterized protein (DUF1778 family)
MPEIALDDLRALIREEVRKPRNRGIDRDSKRPQVICRVLPHEMPLIDAAAEQRGVTRSQFVRDAISAAIGTALQPRQPIPPGLRHSKSRLSERLDQRRALRAASAAIVEPVVSQTASVPVPKLRGPQRPE